MYFCLFYLWVSRLISQSANKCGNELYIQETCAQLTFYPIAKIVLDIYVNSNELNKRIQIKAKKQLNLIIRKIC